MAEKTKPKCSVCGREPIVKITFLKEQNDGDVYFCEKDFNKFCIKTLKATLNKEEPKSEKIEEAVETPKGDLKE